MKYLGKFENYLILEVGETTVPPYEIDNKLDIEAYGGSMGHNYFFTTDSGLRYSINIMEGLSGAHLAEEDVESSDFIDDDPEDFYDKVVAVSFFTFEGEDEDVYSNYNDTVITNRGELFKIMSTLKEVILEYLDENSEIKYLFAGGQRGEKGNDKEQRDRLYLAYFKKQRPDWETDYIYCIHKEESYPIIKIK